MSDAAFRPGRDARGRLETLIGGYRPRVGVPDEMVDSSGRPRPHWLPVLEALAAGEPADVARAFAIADRHQRDSGVYYRVYSDDSGAERPWPLSHVPLVLPEQEWRHIVAGLVQRAGLLETILADLYGEGRLVSDGHLPGAVVAGSPDFVRPVVGMDTGGRRRLQVYAADLGRGPDGRWWVLGDRTQAPSGMGYALENRIALSRAIPDLYGGMNVLRLAPFFQAWRSSLGAQVERGHTRIAMLTPGPLNETYFEHAYLSRYLGFLLVEGGDLTVRDDALFVRTVGGLKRVGVVVRRLDSEFADPVELDPSSQIGVPGLVQAVRAGSVILANALGSGVLESRGLLGFIPALARKLLGQDLLLPNIATWWCGQAAERDHVRRNIQDLALAPAFNRVRDWPLPGAPVEGAMLGAPERAAMGTLLAERPYDVVAHEPVRLSTMPVWQDGRLTPRPFTLRVFVVSTPDGWEVLPGGFCRVSEAQDLRALSMQHGGRSADVWVTSESPVGQTTLLPRPGAVPVSRVIGYLPSRAAENLFWMGRYLERTEATLRVVRCLCGLVVENSETSGPAREALLRTADLLVAWGATAGPPAPRRGAAAAAIADALYAPRAYGSTRSLVLEARRAASVIRERLAPDAVRALSALVDQFDRPAAAHEGPGEALEAAESGLRTIAAISGLAQENMNRLSGWRFLEIGRRIERGILTGRFLRRFADENAPASCLDALLELSDSQITYRARYLMGTERAPVVDLAALDAGNPRSIAFQAARLRDHISNLADLPTPDALDQAAAIVNGIIADLTDADAVTLSADDVLAVENRLMDLSNEITLRFFTQSDLRGEAEDQA
ncbi:circularly permuted type 2 ATP-grasp protein [uncultured Alsobacter sp.]|uniref:circularly permuted type 2 ATP-grasp protein n=1 Tax=uncultured Alsobacter sp. TaxID=1748258 RepID=UPI0025CC1705|nr:circularly permuted type 2 ATP-grasp protein [uncultured Alsobacter sp.]